ncbi:hypothetical protein MHYP_G00106810 [Metynnis hypsauchen]
MGSHVAGAGVRHIASRLFTSFPCTMVIVSARMDPHPSHRLITGISKLKQHSEGKEAAAAMLDTLANTSLGERLIDYRNLTLHSGKQVSGKATMWAKVKGVKTKNIQKSPIPPVFPQAPHHLLREDLHALEVLVDGLMRLSIKSEVLCCEPDTSQSSPECPGSSDVKAMDDHPTVDGQQRRDEIQLGEINEPHLGLIKTAPRPWEDSLSLPEWL